MGGYADPVADLLCQGLYVGCRERHVHGQVDVHRRATGSVHFLHGPCKQGKPLAVNAELKVVGNSPTSFMSMDSTDSAVSSRFVLSWRKC